MFESPLADLSRAGVDFIVVGGLAVAEAGFSRQTEDIDLLVEASAPNLRLLISALSARGEGAAAELSPEDFPLEEGAIRVIEDAVFDLFTQMSGRTYADLFPLTTTRNVHGETIHFLNAEGLLLLKAPSLRKKDQIDADALRQIARGEDLS